MKIINKKNAIRLLKNGLPLLFSTDTLPAIGCLPEYSELIYKIKKREKNKALILMGSEISQILDYVHISARNDFKDIAEKYWPGPLTMVIPINQKKKLKIGASNNTLGIRIPNSLMARSLISETGPLATSSANISGMPSKTTAQQVSMNFPFLNLLGPVPWENCSGQASTIIAWSSKGKWELIREGHLVIEGI